MDKKTKSLAISGLLSALGVVILYIGSLLQVMSLATIFVASFLVVIAVLELKSPWHFLIWIVTSLIALLIMPNKFDAFEYAVFGGLYPILKYYYEKLSRNIANVLKIASFNAIFVVVAWAFIWLVGLNEGIVLPFIGAVNPFAYMAVLAVLGNIVFVIYDVLLTRFIIIYENNYRKRLKRIFK